MEEKINNAINVIGGMALALSIIIVIAIIWADIQYQDVLVKSSFTSLLIFALCWLIHPGKEDEFDQED